MDGFEIFDPRFLAYVLPNAPLVKLGEGFAWLEGPVWFADHDCLLVSDLPNDRIMRWTEGGGVSVFRAPSGFANGHTRDREGRQFAPDPFQHIRVFDVSDEGRLQRGRVFHKVMPGFADGLRLDQDGNVWSSAGDAVHCIAPDGDRLGVIKVGRTVSNLAFGGRNRARLFICASRTLFAIYTNQRGAERP